MNTTKLREEWQFIISKHILDTLESINMDSLPIDIKTVSSLTVSSSSIGYLTIELFGVDILALNL